MKQNVIGKLTSNFGVLAALLTGLYIVSEVMDSVIVHHLLVIYIYCFIFFSLRKLKGNIAVLTLLLIGITVVLIPQIDHPLQVLVDGATANLPIVCILMVTPLLGIPVKIGHYVDALRQFGEGKRETLPLYYLKFFLTTHILSVILNIGSILINYHLLDRNTIQSKKIIATMLMRGYTTTVNWSPYLGVMALVLSHLHVQWTSLIVYTIGFTVFSIIMSFCLDYARLRQENQRTIGVDEQQPAATKESTCKLLELSLFICLSMILVFSIERFAPIHMVLSIILVALVFPFGWSIWKRQKTQYIQEVQNHFGKTMPNLQSEFTMFLVAGIFSSVFVQSASAMHVITSIVEVFSTSVYGITMMISFVIIITGVIGLHPVVMLTVFLMSIQPSEIGISSLHFAALLLASSSIANTVSPATAVNNILAKTLKVDVFTVSVRWNAIYALILFVVLPIYLLVIGI